MLINLENLNSNYKVEKKIGSGAMGDVYLALDKRLERYVAIKLLKFSNVQKDDLDEFTSRFKVEAKSIARLNHTNIVGIYDIGSENDSHYMIMEFIDGNNLGSVIKSAKQKIPLNLIASIGFQIASALEYAHENNIIHRDIKPDNIILSKNGFIKVTDFGIAKFGQTKLNLAEETPTIVGSILYASPEQLKNSDQVDFRTDIYALGVTLYELITGIPPFYDSKDTKETITRIFTEEPEDVRHYYPGIPLEFVKVLQKCLDKSPQKRFQTATGLKEALIPFLKDGEELVDSSASNLVDLAKSSSDHPRTSINPKINTFMKSSFMLKNKLMNTSTRNTSIFDTGIDHISKVNPNIKKYTWIKKLLAECKIKKVSSSAPKDLLDELTQKSTLGQDFTGVVIIDDFFFIFLYESNLIGALVDLDEKKVLGDKAIEYLPEICEKVELISVSDKYLHYPILIYNIIASGLEVYSDIDKINTDLDFLFDRLTSEEEHFTGILECQVVKSLSSPKILHIEDDKVSQIVISNSLKKLPFQSQYFNAESIEEAVKLIRENKYDFIILDLFLKDGEALLEFLLKSGEMVDLIEEIKKDQAVPILITTSSGDPKIAVAVMKKGEVHTEENIGLTNYIVDYKIKSPDSSYFNEINYIIENFLKNKPSNAENDNLLYYMAFSNSKHLFTIQSDVEKNEVKPIFQNVSEIKENHDLKINIYKYKIDFLNFNIVNLMNKTTLKKVYKNSINIILKSILEQAEFIPNETQKALEENIVLEVPSDLKVSILDSSFNLDQKIKMSPYYNFSLWVLKKLFYKLNKQENKEAFSSMYNNIHNIESVQLFGTLSGTDSKMHKFNCIFRDKSNNIIFLARFGSNAGSKIEEFIKETSQIKKLNKELKGAFYISTEDYYPSDLDIIKKYTKTSGFSFFDKLAKYTSIVRVDDGFFHINIIQYDKHVNEFDVIYPVI